MSYLVLARRLRPKSFDTLVGQDHVVRALKNSLDSHRLHHAWLFSGTRGIGKTTLSRILAKALNCETGITSMPCNQCQICKEIDSGRFIDYLEIDAASNRGIEEMTQLIEKTAYFPTIGRFKIYMIDEIHMLTGHAFNAMLKILEEPPKHVKFIFATTNPQKIPITILSRCLQFNLRSISSDTIIEYLKDILTKEFIESDSEALYLIAKSAKGSMRDALSLTEQAMSHSISKLKKKTVCEILGIIDPDYLIRLLDAIASNNALEILSIADKLALYCLSYTEALSELATLLSKIAIAQHIDHMNSKIKLKSKDIIRLAKNIHPDAIQLFYSIAVHSCNELSFMPDEYSGFIMACLRMLALVNNSENSKKQVSIEKSIEHELDFSSNYHPDKII